MLNAERKLWNALSKHWPFVVFLTSTMIACLARFYMRGYISDDMTQSLIPWYEIIKERGGFASLSQPVGNYNIPYQTIIAMLTYIPFKPIYLYKLVSCLFDWLLAVMISIIVIHATRSRLRASVAYGAALNLPIVVFNSSMWGQCDSIYCFFCLLAIYLLWGKKYAFSFIALGAAFSFKLQTIFVLPFFLFYYVRSREFSLLQLLWIPLMMVLMSLGGILQGLPVLDVFDVYLGQTITFTEMSINYPGFWNFLIQVEDFDYYLNLFRYGILLSVFILILMMICLLRDNSEWTEKDFYQAVFLMTYTCVFFLPAMHERYSYCYLILGLLLCFLDLRILPIFMVLFFIDLASYSAYLFPKNPELPWRMVSLFNCICYAVSCYSILYRHFAASKGNSFNLNP